MNSEPKFRFITQKSTRKINKRVPRKLIHSCDLGISFQTWNKETYEIEFLNKKEAIHFQLYTQYALKDLYLSDKKGGTSVFREN